MMHPQVFISGLILLLQGALGSYTVVEGVVGHPVTLPYTYSTNGGVHTACWGLGECMLFYCSKSLIWTNGYYVYYKRSSRYQLKGHISEGNLSLTIENAVQSDSGPYCCIVAIPGSFRFMTYSLEIKPDWKSTLISSKNNYTSLMESR
ncbi:T-cell immunoglobulin and mucin domain-containing protein 2-like isoform X2 [Peromyscus maniculatus bairdii]|uniref:T-cell immunoglobulin and mucin domain-containing protein 2-like isoform X2 n=1 Tax=Peromyscus maniculatus bairdii TaxID=230844 RepID=UPI003FD2ED7F